MSKEEWISVNERYRHFELNVMVSTEEEDFSLNKMFALIANAIRGENENRYVLAGQPIFPMTESEKQLLQEATSIIKSKDEEIERLKGLMYEVCVRANIIFPETEEALDWFDEQFKRQHDLLLNISATLGLGEIDEESVKSILKKFGNNSKNKTSYEKNNFCSFIKPINLVYYGSNVSYRKSRNKRACLYNNFTNRRC